MMLRDLHSTAITVEEMLALAGYNPDKEVIQLNLAIPDCINPKGPVRFRLASGITNLRAG